MQTVELNSVWDILVADIPLTTKQFLDIAMVVAHPSTVIETHFTTVDRGVEYHVIIDGSDRATARDLYMLSGMVGLDTKTAKAEQRAFSDCITSLLKTQAMGLWENMLMWRKNLSATLEQRAEAMRVSEPVIAVDALAGAGRLRPVALA